MSDIFISYSSKDKKLAEDLHNLILSKGLTSFMAEISIKAGNDWEEEILKELKETEYVIFLASKNSIKSVAVQQELGAALMEKKNIIPLLIDIKPEDLPESIKKYQAIDLNTENEKINGIILDIKLKIKTEDLWESAIFCSIGALIWILAKPK